MSLTIHTIPGPPQSGKSTILRGALREFNAAGIPCLLVFPSENLRLCAIRLHPVPCQTTWVRRAPVVVLGSDIRVVGIDDYDERLETMRETYFFLREWLSQWPGPTQLILVTQTL